VEAPSTDERVNGDDRSFEVELQPAIGIHALLFAGIRTGASAADSPLAPSKKALSVNNPGRKWTKVATGEEVELGAEMGTAVELATSMSRETTVEVPPSV
jgi:hypothetical protein